MPTQSSASSSGSSPDEDDGASSAIIATVVIAVVLLAVIISAAVFMVSKNKAMAGTARGQAKAGFENPLYGSPNQAHSHGPANPTGQSSGYMDVPATHPTGGVYGTPGQVATAVTGYMDVSPATAGEDSEEDV